MSDMVWCKVALIFAAVFSFVLCQFNSEFDSHKMRIKAFPCKKPQIRTVYLREIINNDTLWELKYKKFVKDIHPPATVLGRCDMAGCCAKYNERCQAKYFEEIELVFANLNRRVEFFSLTAENHTECSCQVISDNRIK